MTVASTTQSPECGRPSPPLPVLLRRVVGLTFVVSFVEVTVYMDVGRIYPGIMTGNTVEFGRSVALHHWSNAVLTGSAIGSFFCGCMCASLIRRYMKWPCWELLLMAMVLLIVTFVRLSPTLQNLLELPLVALAIGMQGETLTRFGGVSLQTLVVTNNMVKFADGFIGRYIAVWLDRKRFERTRPTPKEVFLPGAAWLCYFISSMLGAIIEQISRFGLFLPIVVLFLTVYDLRHSRYAFN
ncbi:YoaK family protein [Komagataeibacter diospyri]|uniref:YoaK family protein n=1 Tax=Komagataeibacter diospyri TaxID=1932662 RepID=UPI00375834FB